MPTPLETAAADFAAAIWDSVDGLVNVDAAGYLLERTREQLVNEVVPAILHQWEMHGEVTYVKGGQTRRARPGIVKPIGGR